MKKKHMIFMMFLLMFLIGIQKSESLATFYIKNFEINSEVLSNGDMIVEENITYYSTETKNGVTREIDIENSNNSKNSADGLTLRSVKVDGIYAKKVVSGSLGDEGVYEYKTSGSRHSLKVYVPFRGVQTRTVTYEYLLKNVGVRYNDTSEIYWNFIGDEWDTKILNLRINIELPINSINGTTYVFGHGSDNGTFTKNGNYITLSANNLSAYQPIDARILFSDQALSDTTKIVNKDVLDKYIDQEEGLSEKREEPELLMGLSIKDIAIILSIIIILLGVIIYFKYDKEVTVQKHYYYRDIPYDLEPELLQRIYYGKKRKDSFWIAFLNLVKMGVYKIEESTNEVGKKVQLIVYQGQEGKKLKDYQVSLVTTINGFFDSGNTSIDMDKLNAKMKLTTGSGYRSFVNRLESEIEGYFGDNSKVSKRAFSILVILMIVLIIFISAMSLLIQPVMTIMTGIFLSMTTLIYSILFSTITFESLYLILFFAVHFFGFQSAIITMMKTSGVGMLYIPYIILFFLLQYVQRIKRLSKEERQIKEQIKGLRRYLRDYSKISERTLESMVIWEDYLIIAIALKLNNRTINYFYDYCIQNLNDEFGTSLNSFGTYYYMDTMCRRTFNRYVNSNTRTYSGSSRGSSYSGSRGGFSGGRSSGGGGRRTVEEEALSKNKKRT